MAIDELRTTDEQPTAGVNGHTAPFPLTPATPVVVSAAMAARIRALAEQYPYNKRNMQTAERRANRAAQALGVQVQMFVGAFPRVWHTDTAEDVESIWALRDRIVKDPVYLTYLDASSNWDTLREGRAALLDLLVDEETLGRERELEREWEQDGGQSWMMRSGSEEVVPSWWPLRYERRSVQDLWSEMARAAEAIS